MTCPECGEKTIVYHTTSECDCVIRYRKCIKCDYHFKTEESEVREQRKRK